MNLDALSVFYPSLQKKVRLISLPSAKLVAEFQPERGKIYEVGRPFVD